MSAYSNTRKTAADQALLEVEAWQEHQALLMALKKAPTLANHPEFTALRMDAFERFSNSYLGDV